MRHQVAHRYRVYWIIAVIVVVLLSLLLTGSSASTLGGLSSAPLWAGTSTQSTFRKASVHWGLQWKDEGWVVSSAAVSFFGPDDSQASILNAGHRVTVALTYGEGSKSDHCEPNASTTENSSSVSVSFSSCPVSIQAAELQSVAIGIDGSVVIGTNGSGGDSSLASLASPVSDVSGAIQVDTNSSGNTTLSVSHAADPEGNPVLLRISAGDEQGTAESISVPQQDADGLARPSYSFDSATSTLVITLPNDQVIGPGSSVNIAAVPTQLVGDSTTTYAMGLYEGVSPTKTQSCEVTPSGSDSYTATFSPSQVAIVPSSVTADYVGQSDELPLSTGVNFQCDQIHYDSPKSVDLHYSLSNQTNKDLTKVIMTFDMSKDPINASADSQLSFGTYSDARETLSYDAKLRVLTVTYNFQRYSQSEILSAGASQNDIQVGISNFPVVEDTNAKVTKLVASASGSGSKDALITMELQGSTPFPKSWSTTVDMNTLVCPVRADDTIAISNGAATKIQQGKYTISPSTEQSQWLMVWKGHTTVFSGENQGNLHYSSATQFSSFTACVELALPKIG